MPTPVASIPSPIPHGKTAQRLTWPHLPPHIRELIETRCGSPVVEHASQGGGYTPGFASVLTCADGSRHFVKAASDKAQKMFAASYREEGRKLRLLPRETPAPRLLWVHDEDWVVLGLEYVDCRAPRRPWKPKDLDAALDALEVVAQSLTPAPVDLRLDSFADELAAWPSFWSGLDAHYPELTERLTEASALAAGFASVVGGDTVVHTDVRDDNTLILRDGTALLCDWNWPVVGAAWLDTLLMLIGPRGDGLDVDSILASRALTRDIPADHLDRVLAVVCGYFLKSALDPVPPTSPYLRDGQLWQGQVVWSWLSERRGW